MNISCNYSTKEQIHDIVKDAKALFSHGSILPRTIQRLRPYICPFHRLIAFVPKGISVLDVGCGSGIFLGLLMMRVDLSTALGFDSSKDAIELATTMRRNLPPEMIKNITFECYDANQSWPDDIFDMVSMIDVMHHVRPAAQHEVFLKALAHVKPGGLLLYKDMAERPILFALANRLHDLIMARQWIHYVPIAQVRSWGTSQGLHVEEESQCRMLWYAHEWILFKKP
jgi:2-polyprenyl-3-methyl-5-hydroxy-6-metoxy-1,4-benzoquinol methylase